jgi:hypothetical protein
MAHTRRVNWRKGVGQGAPNGAEGSDRRRIAQDEGVDQTGPAFEFARAATANTPAAMFPLGGVVGSWGVVLLEEVPECQFADGKYRRLISGSCRTRLYLEIIARELDC